jgi:hypothetical protein
MLLVQALLLIAAALLYRRVVRDPALASLPAAATP